MITNALSIDVEDYFQVSGFESVVSRTDWDDIPSRVVNNTRRLLAIFDRHEVKATKGCETKKRKPLMAANGR